MPNMSSRQIQRTEYRLVPAFTRTSCTLGRCQYGLCLRITKNAMPKRFCYGGRRQ
ncbi:hypothetical protein PIB30_113916, partial [Stylosanthes scabra]|nr:hypothetical protein [Stylosanthes scabra]